MHRVKAQFSFLFSIKMTRQLNPGLLFRRQLAEGELRPVGSRWNSANLGEQ
jgi:hypothetical protein